MLTQSLKKFREPLAFGLLVVAALYLASGISLLFKSRDDIFLDFAGRAALVGHVFADPVLVISLVVAVTLVAAFGEPSRSARPVVLTALALGGLTLLFAIISWLAGLSADRISSYGGVDGAGKVLGIFLGLAQVGFVGLMMLYFVAVWQSFPKPVRAPAWGQAGMYGWGPAGPPPGWNQAQPGWGQPDPYQQSGWGQPGQPAQPGAPGAASYGPPPGWGQPPPQAWQPPPTWQPPPPPEQPTAPSEWPPPVEESVPAHRDDSLSAAADLDPFATSTQPVTESSADDELAAGAHSDLPGDPADVATSGPSDDDTRLDTRVDAGADPQSSGADDDAEKDDSSGWWRPSSS